jgi:outer membrane usher protein
VLTEGHLFATRRATESYALVEVAGYGNVGVGLGNNVLARTDADGIALIPNLVPYQSNSVRLDVQDLPMSAEIDSIEQGIVPGWRSIVKVKFPVRSGRGALVKISFEDGDVAPAGATVHIEGDAEEFYVARRGEAFVTGMQARNRLVLKWKERECRFEVVLPPETPDEIPRVGPLLCKGVTR